LTVSPIIYFLSSLFYICRCRCRRSLCNVVGTNRLQIRRIRTYSVTLLTHKPVLHIVISGQYELTKLEMRFLRWSVSIVSDYALDDRCSIPGRGKGFFFRPLRPDRLWDPPNLLYNGYRESFLGGKARPGRETDHSPHLVPRSRISSKSYTSSPPKRLHGV
jgi:hypothetical protein